MRQIFLVVGEIWGNGIWKGDDGLPRRSGVDHGAKRGVGHRARSVVGREGIFFCPKRKRRNNLSDGEDWMDWSCVVRGIVVVCLLGNVVDIHVAYDLVYHNGGS